MKLVVCLDKNNGISFFGKRQSQDELQRKNLFELIEDKKLYVAENSYDLYKDYAFNFEIINENTEINNDAVFLYEGDYLDKFLPYTDEIICYFWNRDYPFDKIFEEHLKNIWKENEKVEFKGKSHDEITRIRYVKED
ncbi:hypothetical protein [uncultured Parvimonas sp.]|jgi:hypothetical protein|uniref:hypothetical protein n=1 Tax=uncultured Parvimonas sp. TaxID=747372 RepID=UPI0028D8F9C3|nr:hypothetical protein [uncultured Parvimonas sp.]